MAKKKWFKMSYGIIIIIISFFMNHKKITSKSLKNCIDFLKIMFFDTIITVTIIIK